MHIKPTDRPQRAMQQLQHLSNSLLFLPAHLVLILTTQMAALLGTYRSLSMTNCHKLSDARATLCLLSSCLSGVCVVCHEGVHVCVHVCCRAHESSEAGFLMQGTQFTCCTSTKVQILTPEAFRFVSNGLRARQAGVYKQVWTHQQARSSDHA